MFVSPILHTHTHRKTCRSVSVTPKVFGILHVFQLLAWFHWQFSQNIILPSFVKNYTCEAFCFLFLTELSCCFLSFAWYTFCFALEAEKQKFSNRFLLPKNQVCLKYSQLDEGLLEGEREVSPAAPTALVLCVGQWKSQSQSEDQGVQTWRTLTSMI